VIGMVAQHPARAGGRRRPATQTPFRPPRGPARDPALGTARGTIPPGIAADCSRHGNASEEAAFGRIALGCTRSPLLGDPPRDHRWRASPGDHRWRAAPGDHRWRSARLSARLSARSPRGSSAPGGAYDPRDGRRPENCA
jgi:hypothetical protein